LVLVQSAGSRRRAPWVRTAAATPPRTTGVGRLHRRGPLPLLRSPPRAVWSAPTRVYFTGNEKNRRSVRNAFIGFLGNFSDSSFSFRIKI
jgi:hypothetical protein